MSTDIIHLDTWIIGARHQLESLPKAILGGQERGDDKATEALKEEVSLLTRIVDCYDRIDARSIDGTTELRDLLDSMHQGIQHCAQAAKNRGHDEQTTLCLDALEDIEARLHDLRRA